MSAEGIRADAAQTLLGRGVRDDHVRDEVIRDPRDDEAERDLETAAQPRAMSSRTASKP
jgi:hypothetical protein